MARDADDVLTIDVDLNVRRSIQELSRFQKEMLKRLNGVTKGIDGVAKAGMNAGRKSAGENRNWMRSIEDLEDAYKNHGKQLSKEEELLDALYKQAKQASGEQAKGIERKIALQKKAMSQNEKELKQQKKAGRRGGGGGAGSFQKDMVDISKMVAAPLKSLFQKDIKGAVQDLAPLLGKSLKGMAKGGLFLKGAGAGMQARGKDMGGAGGLGLQAMGKLTKGIGSIGASMAPVMQAFAKLGPLVGLIGSGIMAIVKLFIDAEAQAKEFQKSILDSASTSEFFYSNMRNANSAAEDLNVTLKTVRDTSHDFSFNNAWGIMAEDHAKILNTLNQEGVSLKALQMEAVGAAAATGKTVRTAEDAREALTSYQQELVATSIAYSRALGIPLQEINQMQGEMMTDLGMSLQDTKNAFHEVTRSAAESGVASNKFFAMIRGVSQDLSMYNTRMGDAVKILGLMNKVMNPKNASKFFQTVTQGLKNMGQDDRLRLNLLTGGRAGEDIKKDIARKQSDLAGTIGKTLGMDSKQVQSDLADPKKAQGIWDALAKAAPERVGSLREAHLETKIDASAAKKGVYGQAFAMENASAGTALDIMKKALVGWGGGKNLQDGAGSIGMTKMAENLGIGTEQLRNMMKLEAALEEQKQALVAKGTVTQKQADEMSSNELFDKLDKGTQEQLKNANEEINYAKQQTELTDTVIKKLERLIQFLMNQVYNAMTGIWDTILETMGSADHKASRAISKQMDKSSNQDLQDAWKSSGGNQWAFRGEMAKSKGVEELVGKMKSGSNEGTMAANNMLSLMGAGDLKDAFKDAGLEDKYSSWSGNDENFHNLAPEDQNKVIEKMVGRLDPQVLAKNYEKLRSDAGLSGSSSQAPPTAGTPTTSTPEYDMRQDANSEIPMKKWAGAGQPPAAPPATDTAKPSAAPSPATTPVSEKTGASQIDVAKTQVDAVQAVESTLSRTQFDRSFLKGDFSRTMEESVLSAVRQALFEYYLYSEVTDRKSVLDYMGATGMSPTEFSKNLGSSGKTAGDFTKLDANAEGGLVTGVGGGLATVRAAAGEGLASVGRGERIMPAGAGGSPSVNISVQGIGGNDLAKVIEAKVIDGIAEYKRRERFN